MKSIAQIVYELSYPEESADKEKREMKEQLQDLVRQMHMSGIFYSEGVREFKKHFLLEVLRFCRGNQCQAARVLGMHRNTLSRTLAELKLDVREIRTGIRRRPVCSAIPDIKNSEARQA